MTHNIWKVICDEKRYPGLWRKWYEEQCVAVGWAPKWFKLEGKSPKHSWSVARNCIEKVQAGDQVVVQMANHRVGRIGTVVESRVGDDQWDPTVPPSVAQPEGEHGSRILVRWDLKLGSLNPDIIVSLPEKAQIPNHLARVTIAQLSRAHLKIIHQAMSDKENCVSMFSYFAYERALSDYVAEFPHRLEPGLEPYPKAGKITEKALQDGKRLDVLLRSGYPVVVECKRADVRPESVDQLLGYITRVKKLTKVQRVRGILVHGGARSLSTRVRRKLRAKKHIRVFQYLLNLDFVESK